MAFAVFLGLAYCLVHLSVASHWDLVSTEQCDRRVDAVVVGSGASGAYIAYRMRKSNQTIEMVECLNRTGGRIYTSSLPNAPEIKLEMGIGNYIKDQDVRVERLLKELGLVPEKHVTQDADRKILVRGLLLTKEEMKQNKSLPFDLTQEERDNQENLSLYYLRLLTGFNGTEVSESDVMNLRLKDGTPLYEKNIHEVLKTVASVDGIDFLKASCIYDGFFAPDANAVDFFHAMLVKNATKSVEMTLPNGMSTLTDTLIKGFLEAKPSNKLSTSRKLESIKETDEKGVYLLRLRETALEDGELVEKNRVERVCAKKVILAIPLESLKKVEWSKLKSEKVSEAIEAVTPIKLSKAFVALRNGRWVTDSPRPLTSGVESDVPFGNMVYMGSSNVSGEAVIMASLTDHYRTDFLNNLNFEGKSIDGSAPKPNQVSEKLYKELLFHIADAAGLSKKDIPETTGGISSFWTKYPIARGYTVLKSGYNHEEVRQTIQHPSFSDDIYVIGSDHQMASAIAPIETSIASVDEVCDKYQI